MEVINVITKSDLVSLEEKILEIKALLKANSTPTEWLKSNEVKELLKCGDGTLQKLRNNGELPYKKILGTIYYDRKDINKLFAEA